MKQTSRKSWTQKALARVGARLNVLRSAAVSVLSGTVLFGAVLFGAGLVAAPPALAGTLTQTAKDIGSLKQLLRAVEAAGLGEALAGPGPFTLFAPTDEAFGELPKVAVDDLMQPHNREKLRKLLRHHLLPGLVLSRDYAGKRLEAIPMAGDALLLDARTQPKIAHARIVRSDIVADNGVIHVIDAVLIPSFDDIAASPP